MKKHVEVQYSKNRLLSSIILSILVIGNISNVPYQLHGQTTNNPTLSIDEGCLVEMSRIRVQ